MSILTAIKKQHFGAMKRHESWNYVYYAFDLHGTVIVPNYKTGEIPKEFYPHAKETLQMLSKREDIVMYIYTCSHPHEQEQYVEYFKSLGINFRWVNENPEVETQNNGYGYYEDKPYFNVLFEDKAGFDPNKDWEDVLDYFRCKESLWLRIIVNVKRILKHGFPIL